MSRSDIGYVTPLLIKHRNKTKFTHHHEDVLLDKNSRIVCSAQNGSVRQVGAPFSATPQVVPAISTYRVPLQPTTGARHRGRTFIPTREGIDAQWIICLLTDQSLKFSTGQYDSPRQHRPIPLESANRVPNQHLRILPRPSHHSKPRAVLQGSEKCL